MVSFLSEENMDALNAILERRSVRVFKDEKIERGDIDYILKA